MLVVYLAKHFKMIMEQVYILFLTLKLDAVIHCRFSLLLTGLMFIISFVSLGVLIPVDYVLGTLSNQFAGDLATFSLSSFTRPTLFIWVHIGVSIICGILVFLFAIFVQCVLSRSFRKNDHIFTILLRSIPKEISSVDLFNIFETEYGEGSIKDINELYDMDKYIKLWKKREILKKYIGLNYKS
jgi:hypothetical protein